jgi:hypothetical protein
VKKEASCLAEFHAEFVFPMACIRAFQAYAAPMKFRCLLCLMLALSPALFGQISSVTRRTTQTAGPREFFFPGAPSTTTTQTVVIAVRERSAEELDAIQRKTIEFQKQRAEAGSDTAQYDLAMRYLKGDGLERDAAKARRWLEKSAKSGNTLAAKKLKELPPETPAPKPAATVAP